MQRCGVEEVAASLESENVSLLLVLRNSENEEIVRLRSLAESRGIPVREGSKTDLWRMARSNEGEESPGILALRGRDPSRLNYRPVMSMIMTMMFHLYQLPFNEA